MGLHPLSGEQLKLLRRSRWWDAGSAAGCAPCFTQAGQRVFFQNGIIFANSRIRMASITDGTTNTFLIGESRYMPTRTCEPMAFMQDGLRH